MYKHGLKRVIDFILVFIVLVVIWPILLLITIWLHFANKGAGAPDQVGENVPEDAVERQQRKAERRRKPRPSAAEATLVLPPHEVEYTLTFHSDSLQGVTP